MSQDYRIVFQVETTETAPSSKPTAPSSEVSTSTAPDPESKTSKISVQSVITAIQSPIGTAVGKLAGAIPFVAASLVAVKIADTIVSTSLDFSSEASGDYSGEIAYSNFKIGFGHALRPVSYGLALWRQQIEIDRANKQVRQERVLMGNAVSNGYGRKGV